MKEFIIIKKAIKFAGKKIFLNGSKKINLKGNYDYFTDSDLACEKYLINTIKKYFPNDDILSEETCNKTVLADRTWIIDPIDGTHNYANGMAECGMQVAFYDKGEIIFSVIYLPYWDKMYTCLKGEGVKLNGKPFKVDKSIEMSKAIIAVSSFTHDDLTRKIHFNLLSNMRDKILDIRILGCGCLEFVYCLTKSYGAYIVIRRSIAKWDLLPGTLLCEQSGLTVINKKYKGFEYNIVACNKDIAKVVEKSAKESISSVANAGK